MKTGRALDPSAEVLSASNASKQVSEGYERATPGRPKSDRKPSSTTAIASRGEVPTSKNTSWGCSHGVQTGSRLDQEQGSTPGGTGWTGATVASRANLEGERRPLTSSQVSVRVGGCIATGAAHQAGTRSIHVWECECRNEENKVDMSLQGCLMCFSHLDVYSPTDAQCVVHAYIYTYVDDARATPTGRTLNTYNTTREPGTRELSRKSPPSPTASVRTDR